MKQRRGLGKGLGVGYKNLAPMDSHIHSLSAKGVKTLINPKAPASKNKEYMEKLRTIQKYKFIKDLRTNKSYPRIKYGDEDIVKEGKFPKYCPDCGVAIGNYHQEGCDIEISPLPDEKEYDGQLLSSDNAGNYSLDAKGKEREIRKSLVSNEYYVTSDKERLQQEIKFMKKLEDLDEAGVVSFHSNAFGDVNVQDELKNTKKIIREFFDGRKIPIKEVKILWKEGRSKEGEYPKTFKSVSEATKQIKKNSLEAPATGGYDKHKFTIEWEDGSFYEGRMDVEHPTRKHPDNDMRQHVQEFANYILNKPREEFPQYSKDDRDYAKDLLTKYSLEAKGEKPKVSFRKGRRYLEYKDRTISFYDPTKYTFQEIANFRKQDKTPVKFLGKRVTREGVEKTALGVSIGTIVGAIQPEIIPFELLGAGVLMGARAYSSRKVKK